MAPGWTTTCSVRRPAWYSTSRCMLVPRAARASTPRLSGPELSRADSRSRTRTPAEAPDGRSGGSIAWRARVTGSMVGSLFLRSYERSERIYAAMQARGFEGEFRHLHSRAMRASEWAALGFFFAACAAFTIAAHAWLAPR